MSDEEGKERLKKFKEFADKQLKGLRKGKTGERVTKFDRISKER